MKNEYIMGNSAIALGAMAAGVNLVAGYPGTPSSEILETVAKRNKGDIHVEWSVNEKAAMELAAGAAYTGARALVTMKQVGLNVAADPLMSLAYVGVKGGMVVVVADDPGPISSQTEQDTRQFAEFAKIPVFDPSSPEEAYEMVQDAFKYSEKYKTPVFLRPTTRICHAYANIEVEEDYKVNEYEGFVKDSSKWVIFPRLSFNNHNMIEKRNPEIGKDFSTYRFNKVEGSGTKGIIASGVSYQYVKEYLGDRKDVKLFKVATSYPFPEDLALEFLNGVDEVLAIEELSAVLEKEITYVAGKYNLNVKVRGKFTDDSVKAGENSAAIVEEEIKRFLNEDNSDEKIDLSDMPNLPVRPSVLCAGCPHRASFYAVKQAMKGKKAYFCGDIGCYTLGNAMPLDMVDTCLCMGAGITMAQGLYHMENDAQCFAFVGDSTFFASGITGVVNAVYNEADMILCVLDNSTTAMTGHQPHPGTGRTMMGDIVEKIDIVKILEGIGVKKVIVTDPLNLHEAVEAVKELSEIKGVKAIVFKSPCIAIVKADKKCKVSDKCINCKKCITELGCPALIIEEGKVKIDESLCTGCGLCAKVCPVNAIGGEPRE